MQPSDRRIAITYHLSRYHLVVTSGERHEGKAGMVLFAGKTV